MCDMLNQIIKYLEMFHLSSLKSLDPGAPTWVGSIEGIKWGNPFSRKWGDDISNLMTWLSEAALTTAVHMPFFHWSLYFFSHSSVWLCVVKLIISEYSITWMLDNLPIMQVKLKRIIGVQFGAFRRNIKIAETTEDGTIYLPCFFGVVPSSVLPLIALF